MTIISRPFARNRKLPNEPAFRKLIENSTNIKNVIFHDPSLGVDAKYPQLLDDVLNLRQHLYESLPVGTFDDRGIIGKDTPYVLILSQGNYEFVVASFTVLAFGGAIVPVAPDVLPEEALHFLRKCRSGLILAGSQRWALAKKIEDYANASGHATVVNPVLIDRSTLVAPVPFTETVELDEQLTIDPGRPSIILFTSGTTGPPKGVINSRLFFYYGYGTTGDDVFLTHRPVHWIGGLRSIINLVISGTRQEVVPSNEVVIWQRLAQGGITMLCCIIPMWWKLMNHYKTVLSKLPAPEQDRYIQGARGIRYARIGGAAPTPSLLRFWREEIGVELEVTYGCTETGGPGMCTERTTNRQIERALGRPEKGVTIRFSEGDHGEIFVKTLFLFTGYLDDEEATQASFTEDGFYKTGDYVSLVEGEYVIEGRTKSDFVRYHGFKVPIVEVEQCLLELPFIHEACIVSIPDKEASTRVAALVRFKDDFPAIDLAALRQHLSGRLSTYKLPTALRILQTEEEIPLTVSGKVIRPKVMERYFSFSPDAQLPADVEMWNINNEQSKNHGSRRAWDWAGLQGC